MRCLAYGILLTSLLTASACDDPEGPDAGAPDAGAPDAAPDAGATLDAAPDASPTLDAPPDAAPAPDAPPDVASGIWSIESAPVTPGTESAEVMGGDLVLTVEGDHANACTSVLGRCFPLVAFQRGLEGDFDVALDVASVTGPEHAAVFLFVEVEGAATHYDIGDVGPITFRMRRANDHLVVTSKKATADEEVAFEGTSAGVFRVGIGLSQGGSSLLTRARLAAFTVGGGGGQVTSDAFDEDTTLDP